MKRVIFIFLITLSILPAAVASDIPTGQDVGSAVKSHTDFEKKKAIEEQITAEFTKKVPSISEDEIETLPQTEEAIKIEGIVVQHDPLIEDPPSEIELNQIVSEYAGQTLSLNEMRQIALLVSKKYSSKGFRAYIPKQSFKKGILYINFVSSESYRRKLRK